MKTKIIYDYYRYQSIKQPNYGEIMLSIYPPGSWMGSPGYVIFVGGCGIATEKNLKSAELKLKKYVRQDLLRRISELHDKASYYEQQLKEFEQNGLKRLI